MATISNSDTFSATVYYTNGSIAIKSFVTHGEARRFAEFDKNISKITKNVNGEEVVIYFLAKESNMAGFYPFNQNNSGGYTVVDDAAGIGDYVFIWATSAEGANKKAEEAGMFSLSYCHCCGERFYPAWNDDEPMKNGDSGSFFSVREDINIFFHLPSGEIKKAFIPNNNGRTLSVDYVWNEDIVKALTSN